MLYEIKVNHDDESWEVIAKHSIESEEGAEDELVAVFYNKEQLNSFKKLLQQEQSGMKDVEEKSTTRRFKVTVIDNKTGNKAEQSVDSLRFSGIVYAKETSFSHDPIFKQENALVKHFEKRGQYEKTIPKPGEFLFDIGVIYPSTL